MIIHYFINVTKFYVFVLLLMPIFHLACRQNQVCDSTTQEMVGEHVEQRERSGFRSFSVLFLVFFRSFSGLLSI